MRVEAWDLPVKAEWHRATALGSLSFSQDGLQLYLIEEGSLRRWHLRFPEVQAFKLTTEESASIVLDSLPANGAFYEIVDSEWLQELGQGRLAYMSTAKHYVICCDDEVLEVVATGHSIEPA